MQVTRVECYVESCSLVSYNLCLTAHNLNHCFHAITVTICKDYATLQFSAMCTKIIFLALMADDFGARKLRGWRVLARFGSLTYITCLTVRDLSNCIPDLLKNTIWPILYCCQNICEWLTILQMKVTTHRTVKIAFCDRI